MGRANASGRLLMSFDVMDLPVLLWAGGALSGYLGPVPTAPWRGYVELVLNSYLSDDDPAGRRDPPAVAVARGGHGAAQAASPGPATP